MQCLTRINKDWLTLGHGCGRYCQGPLLGVVPWLCLIQLYCKIQKDQSLCQFFLLLLILAVCCVAKLLGIIWPIRYSKSSKWKEEPWTQVHVLWRLQGKSCHLFVSVFNNVIKKKSSCQLLILEKNYTVLRYGMNIRRHARHCCHHKNMIEAKVIRQKKRNKIYFTNQRTTKKEISE